MNIELLVKTGKLSCDGCGGLISGERGIIRCVDCRKQYKYSGGRAYFAEVPNDSEINSKGREYERWSAWRKANFDYFKNKLSRLPQKGEILDIGAGPSQFYSLFERFNAYIGVDFHPYEHVSVVADITKRFPFSDSSFDVVILSNTIEHIPNTNDLLRECFRVLRPGGSMIATVPFLMRIHQAPYDFNRYTSFALKKFASDAGFHSVEVVPIGLPAHTYDTMQRHFFSYFIGARPYGSPLVNWIFGIATKLIYWANRAILKALFTLYVKVGPQDGYTEGYGLTAIKAETRK